MTKSMFANILKWLTTGAALGALAVALTAFNTNPAAAQEIKELKIALLPTDNPDQEIKAHKPMTDHLAKILGISVKVQIGIDYTAVMKRIAGDLDTDGLKHGRHTVEKVPHDGRHDLPVAGQCQSTRLTVEQFQVP